MYYWWHVPILNDLKICSNHYNFDIILINGVDYSFDSRLTCKKSVITKASYI